MMPHESGDALIFSGHGLRTCKAFEQASTADCGRAAQV